MFHVSFTTWQSFVQSPTVTLLAFRYFVFTWVGHTFYITIKIKIRFIVIQEIHKSTPPHLTHPGWHLLNTHMHKVTHSWREMSYTLERWAAIHSARGAWGYGALLKGTSAVARRWTATPPVVSSPIFEGWHWESTRQTLRLLDDPL